MKYSVVVALQDVGTADSFEDAFKIYHREVDNSCREGTMSLPVLAEACWIKPPNQLPLFHFDIVEKAYDLGLLEEGKPTEQVMDGIHN